MTSSTRNNEVKNKNSILEEVKKWNQVFVKTKQTIKNQSGSGRMKEIKSS